MALISVRQLLSHVRFPYVDDETRQSSHLPNFGKE